MTEGKRLREGLWDVPSAGGAGDVPAGDSACCGQSTDLSTAGRRSFSRSSISMMSLPHSSSTSLGWYPWGNLMRPNSIHTWGKHQQNGISYLLPELARERLQQGKWGCKATALPPLLQRAACCIIYPEGYFHFSIPK